MDTWWLSSIIVVLLVGFFGIALYRVLKEKRLKEVREDFISNMAHELKTPVSGIQLAMKV
jgi:two-component system phosphate regulon sensor histidine kinase PhoR